jgi:hypothetical protein
MLFRNNDGSLIYINKSAYKNDTMYYKKIMSIYKSTNNFNTSSASAPPQMTQMVNTLTALLSPNK